MTGADLHALESAFAANRAAIADLRDDDRGPYARHLLDVHHELVIAICDALAADPTDPTDRTRP